MSETRGRCRSEVDECRGSPSELKIADAIDRLAADVAAIKEAVCDGSVAEERDRFLAGMGSAIKQRDKARRQRDEARAKIESLRESIRAANRLFGAEQAKVERLRKELEQRQPAGNSSKTSSSSPSAPQPAGVSDEQPAMDKDRAAVQRYCAAEQQADTPPAAPQLAATDAKRTFVSSWILRRNRVKGSDWNGSCCPACGGSRRIWFESFHDWTCICAWPEKKAWWDDTNAVDEDWLNELVWRWSVDAKKYPGIPSSSPAAPPPDGNSPKTLDSSPAAPQPAAPPAGWLTERERTVLELIAMERRTDSDLHWFNDVLPAIRSILARAGSPPSQTAPWWLTDEERHILSAHLRSLRDQRRAMERGGQTLGYSADSCAIKREADVIDALLTRAGSPPVVEVPCLPSNHYARSEAERYRAALDKAGVAWKEV